VGAPAAFSAVLEEAGLKPALDARKVLLTETALNVAGFLTDDDTLAWLRSPAGFAESDLGPSVSEPPLTLTSVDRVCSSTLVIRLFAMSALASVPLTEAFGSTSCAVSTFT
jgi:hypothetical protein